MGNAVGGGARVPLGATGSTTFTAPAGMTIADFTLTRQLTYRNGAPADGTRPLYAIYKLGGTVFAGAGRYHNATRARLNGVGSWYGYPESNVVVPRSTVRRSSFPALAGYRGDARTLQIAVGCFNGSIKTACTVAAGGGISHLLSGAQVVLNDPTTPAASIEASGLLVGGERSGSDPITLDATDNGGIRRVEIVDYPGRRRRRRRRGLRDRRAHRHGSDLLLPPRQGVPEPQERDHPPDQPGRGAADPEGPGHRRRRQRARAGAVCGRRRHAVGPRPAQRRGRDRGRQADRPLHRHDEDAAHGQLPLAGLDLGPPPELERQADPGALLRVLTRDRRQSAGWVER